LRAETGMPVATVAALLHRIGVEATGPIGARVLVLDEAPWSMTGHWPGSWAPPAPRA